MAQARGQIGREVLSIVQEGYSMEKVGYVSLDVFFSSFLAKSSTVLKIKTKIGIIWRRPNSKDRKAKALGAGTTFATTHESRTARRER